VLAYVSSIETLSGSPELEKGTSKGSRSRIEVIGGRYFGRRERPRCRSSGIGGSGLLSSAVTDARCFGTWCGHWGRVEIGKRGGWGGR